MIKKQTKLSKERTKQLRDFKASKKRFEVIFTDHFNHPSLKSNRKLKRYAIEKLSYVYALFCQYAQEVGKRELR